MPIAPRCFLALALSTAPLFPAAADNTDDLKACHMRQIELQAKARDFKGEDRMRRLIEADLRRASREESEGDGDECLEALDHAVKLLNGEV